MAWSLVRSGDLTAAGMHGGLIPLLDHDIEASAGPVHALHHLKF